MTHILGRRPKEKVQLKYGDRVVQNIWNQNVNISNFTNKLRWDKKKYVRNTK